MMLSLSRSVRADELSTALRVEENLGRILTLALSQEIILRVLGS